MALHTQPDRCRYSFARTAETVSKLVLLGKVIPEGTPILMWGEPYEAAFLEKMGIPLSQVISMPSSLAPSLWLI